MQFVPAGKLADGEMSALGLGCVKTPRGNPKTGERDRTSYSSKLFAQIIRPSY
jgi:hypothetical protein